MDTNYSFSIKWNISVNREHIVCYKRSPLKAVCVVLYTNEYYGHELLCAPGVKDQASILYYN